MTTLQQLQESARKKFWTVFNEDKFTSLEERYLYSFLDQIIASTIEEVRKAMPNGEYPYRDHSEEASQRGIGWMQFKKELDRRFTELTSEQKEKLMDYERNYSHDHCWKQIGHPDCNQPMEAHKQCCLCDTPYNP